MSTYKVLSLMISFGILVATIIMAAKGLTSSGKLAF